MIGFFSGVSLIIPFFLQGDAPYLAKLVYNSHNYDSWQI